MGCFFAAHTLNSLFCGDFLRMPLRQEILAFPEKLCYNQKLMGLWWNGRHLRLKI